MRARASGSLSVDVLAGEADRASGELPFPGSTTSSSVVEKQFLCSGCVGSCAESISWILSVLGVDGGRGVSVTVLQDRNRVSTAKKETVTQNLQKRARRRILQKAGKLQRNLSLRAIHVGP